MQTIASRINTVLPSPAQPSLIIQDSYWTWQFMLLVATVMAVFIWGIIYDQTQE